MTTQDDNFESWEDFVKEKLSEFDIQKGSDFEAKLYLSFNEMRDIFTQKEYRLKYKIKSLKEELAKERETVDFYADKTPWGSFVDYSSQIMAFIIDSDTCIFGNGCKYGGKLARARQKERK